MKAVAKRSDQAAEASLEEIAALALEFGKSLMQVGSSARQIEKVVGNVAHAAGAEGVEVFVEYSCISVTLGRGEQKITRTSKNPPMGVNECLYRALTNVGLRTEEQGLTATDLRAELLRLHHDASRHSDWLIALAAGIACAAFGRLMGASWLGVGPIFVAAAFGQILRRKLALQHINVFVSATLVAFLASFVCALTSRRLGSATVTTDMIATVLLLVPGVAVFNALYDILEGRPAIGSARAVWVIAMLLFMTAGVWLAQSLLEVSL